MRERAPKCAGIRGYVGVHLGVHFQKVGVHVTPNSLHLTPYSSPQTSAKGRLELPAPGVAREDPRPGLHVSTVHRQPCVNPFQTARTTAPTGLELPAQAAAREDPQQRPHAGFLPGVTLFCRGHRGQMGKSHVSPCQHLEKLSPAAPGTNANLPGTPGTNESSGVRQRPSIDGTPSLNPL